LKNLPVVIICGGKATRLYPRTLTIPKSMIEICGKPFIHWQLEQITGREVILCVGEYSKQIEEYVKDGSQYKLNVKYSYDGDKLLGTGGAIKKALPLIDSEGFFILNGDSYLNQLYMGFLNMIYSALPASTMTLFGGKKEENNIVCEDGIVKKYNKNNYTDDMKYIDYGLTLINKKAFDGKEGKFDLTEVYMDLIKKGQMIGLEVKERFHEIGSEEGIKDTEKYIRSKKCNI